MTEAAQPDAGQEPWDVVDRVLLSLWDAVNSLSHVRRKPSEYRVTIFGSARIGSEDPRYGDVRDLARRLAERGCVIVSGGGPGLMQAANEGENLGDPRNERNTIGVRVHLPFEDGANRFVEEAHLHGTFFSRLHHFVRLSNAFVVVPGGIGTTLEALMVWQLLQVKHVEAVPLVFVGEMWSGLVGWARDHMLASTPPLANAEDLAIPVCVPTVGEAYDVIERHHADFLGRGGG